MEEDTPIYNSLARAYNAKWAEDHPEDNWEFFHISCVHGLSLWLCAGPGHYPPDNDHSPF